MVAKGFTFLALRAAIKVYSRVSWPAPTTDFRSKKPTFSPAQFTVKE
jgi:hypothetical protein